MDSVVDLPPSVKRLAETDLEPNAAFAVGRAIKCVQFHPEFDGDSMRGYIEAHSELIASEGGDPAWLLSRATDAPEGASTLRSFLRFAAGLRDP